MARSPICSRLLPSAIQTQCSAQDLANSFDIFVAVRRRGFEKINGVTTFRMAQIVLDTTEIALVHGGDYGPNNKPACP